VERKYIDSPLRHGGNGGNISTGLTGSTKIFAQEQREGAASVEPSELVSTLLRPSRLPMLCIGCLFQRL